jgi:hypothetical protein
MTSILGIVASSKLKASSSFESIATAVGTGSSGTITFTSIPSTYKHLQIRYVAKHTGTTNSLDSLDITLNGNTGSNYTRHLIVGEGSNVTATGQASQVRIRTGSVIPDSNASLNNMFGVGIIDINDYTSTSNNKTVRTILGVDTNSSVTPVGRITLVSGLWFATPAAITSIQLNSQVANWTTTTVFSLYGIKG